MGGCGRLALQRAHDHLFDLRIAQLAELSETRLIEHAVQPLLIKPAPPFTDCLNTLPTAAPNYHGLGATIFT